MKRLRTLGIGTMLAAALALAATPAMACPFCSAPSLTLTEQLSQADAALLVQWVEGEKPKTDSSGQTVYEIVQVVKKPDGNEELKKGERITLSQYRAGKVGDLFLLTGTRATVIEWSSPLEVTEASFNYIVQAPSPEEPTPQRLEYFLKFLEYPDQLVANDAYGEFANAPYEDITKIADKMPQDKVRKWVKSPETPATRLGLYGLMMGLCGDSQDAKLMEELISKKTEDFRLGIDGVMSGYLLLTGESGLDMIDEQKLRDKSIPFSETYAGMQALRFMWQYAPGRIAPERLQHSMRILLDRPELADLVIADLARWKDWGVQEKLFSMYGAEEYDIPSIKRAIVRYFLVCVKNAPDEEGAEKPKHVAQAEKYLAQLREQDPRTVKEAERFLFLP